MGLTFRQIAFVEHYLAGGELNATEAYRQAGFPSKNPTYMANRLLKRPNLRAYIEQRKKELRKEINLTPGEARYICATIAKSPLYQPHERMKAIEVWAKLTGAFAPERTEHVQIDVAALMRLSPAEQIEAFNRGWLESAPQGQLEAPLDVESVEKANKPAIVEVKTTDNDAESE